MSTADHDDVVMPEALAHGREFMERGLGCRGFT
jgi:hypothetical protein